MDPALIYDRFWESESRFTPGQPGHMDTIKPAVFTEEMRSCFSDLLCRDVLGVDTEPVGNGVFNVVCMCTGVYRELMAD